MSNSFRSEMRISRGLLPFLGAMTPASSRLSIILPAFWKPNWNLRIMSELLRLPLLRANSTTWR